MPVLVNQLNTNLLQQLFTHKQTVHQVSPKQLGSYKVRHLASQRLNKYRELCVPVHCKSKVKLGYIIVRSKALA